MKNDNKEPIALTVNEGMEQALENYLVKNVGITKLQAPTISIIFSAGYQANNSYAKAIEDAISVIKKMFDMLPEPDTNENRAFYSLLNTIIERLKQLS